MGLRIAHARGRHASMAFWIVYQGNIWKLARAGGYLWAPKLGKKQQTQLYWSNMARVCQATSFSPVSITRCAPSLK
jgi:hypothetical protein